MLGFVDSIARRLVRRGLRRGLVEGSALWAALGALAWLVRLMLKPEPEKIVREDLRVGETLVISHVPAPPSRRERRRSERRGGGAAEAPPST